MTQCPREPDVFDAVLARRWPARVDEDLRTHVATCPACADLAEVAVPLAAEQHAAWDEAVDLPPADLVYWRAQLRARSEASRRASLPIGIVQAMSAAAFAGVGVAVLGSVFWWLRSSWSTMFSWSAPSLGSWSLPSLWTATSWTSLQPSPAASAAFAAVLLCLILAPITVYLVAAEPGSDN